MTNFNTEQMLIMRYRFNPLIPLDLMNNKRLSVAPMIDSIPV